MRTEHMTEIEGHLKHLAPSVILLRCLNRLVPEFSTVRQRLRDASEELWNGLAEELNRFASEISGEQSLAEAIRRIESELKSNEELNQRLGDHLKGLQQISSVIGDPPHLVNLMLQEDFKIAIGETGLLGLAVNAMTAPESRDPFTLTAEAYQILDYGFYQVSETVTPYQLLERKTATAASSEFKSLEKSIRSAVTKQDPSWPVLTYVLRKVMGMDQSKVASLRDRSEQTIRHDVKRAGQMLKIKMRPGRPKKGSLPTQQWDRMEFHIE